MSNSKYLSVYGFSVHLNIEASVFYSVYSTVQEWQTMTSSDIFLSEIDVTVHSMYMFYGFYFPCSDLTQVSSTNLNQWLGAVLLR